MNAQLFAPPPAIRDRYGVTLRQLKDARKRRQVTFAKIGHRTVLISVPSVEKWIAARTMPALGEPGK